MKDIITFLPKVCTCVIWRRNNRRLFTYFPLVGSISQLTQNNEYTKKLLITLF